jgi:predicted amidohydrolase YtcJ
VLLMAVASWTVAAPRPAVAMQLPLPLPFHLPEHLPQRLGGSEPAAADLVLMNGRIVTLDPRDHIAQALAVRDGRIVRIGSDAAIASMVGDKTRIIDLRGRTATPGLIDTHAHILETGVDELYHVRLEGARSVAALLAAVAKRAATARPGEWIVGAGWDEGKLAEARYPTAAELDTVSAGHPVWLEHATGHYGVANTAALKLAGITAETRDPEAGTIERTATGAPAGVLKETAQTLVRARIPPITSEQRAAALEHMVAQLHREGMTGFKDPDLRPEEWSTYLAAARANQLASHVCVLMDGGRTLESVREAIARVRLAESQLETLPGTTLGVCGVKLFMDGSGAAPTAWMYQDWNRRRSEVATGNRGYPQTDPEVYRQQVKLLVDAGVGIGTHAIGDRAIDWVVDSYAEALKATPVRGLRLSIIHANTPTDHAITQMAWLQKTWDAGYPESQAGFAWWLGDIYAANLGAERSQRLNPYRTYLSNHVIWTGGSDAPVTPWPARHGLWASAARQTLNGTWGAQPFGVSEAVDARTALLSYTAWAARQIRAEARTGTLEVGKSADIAVWNLDPSRAPGAALKELGCEITVFRGRIVWRKSATD